LRFGVQLVIPSLIPRTRAFGVQELMLFNALFPGLWAPQIRAIIEFLISTILHRGNCRSFEIFEALPQTFSPAFTHAGHSSRHSRWARYNYLEPVGAGLRCVRSSRVHVEEKAAPFLRGLSFGQVLHGI
jgi:hypothetical protein